MFETNNPDDYKKQSTKSQTDNTELGDFRPQEVINRIEYKYMQTDGTIDFPNSYEGDTLRIAYKTAQLMKQQDIKSRIDEQNKIYDIACDCMPEGAGFNRFVMKLDDRQKKLRSKA